MICTTAIAAGLGGDMPVLAKLKIVEMLAMAPWQRSLSATQNPLPTGSITTTSTN